MQQTPFVDGRNTVNDPVLLGPPSLEFAPFAKISGSRVRKDARQGTIDQDPDFIAFLESLTQPIAKPTTVETTADEGEEKQEMVTVTPLVQYIKEKKASKAKESAASSKSGKHSKAEKEGKPEKVQTKKLLQRADKEASAAPPTEKKPKADKVTKEAVKAANKQAAIVSARSSSKAAATASQQSAMKDATHGAEPERKRERGNISAAAKILQRDLGLAVGGGRRRGTKGSSTDADAKVERPSREMSTASESTKRETPPTKASKRSTAAANTKAKGNATPQPAAAVSTEARATLPVPAQTPAPPKQSKSARGKQPAAASTSPTATQAFLKHANPSQGVTEKLLETSFTPFGKILKVEIDRKKGFGYIDFAEPEGLQKAIAASPVSVAQSQVVVLERKINAGAERARGKGRSESQSANNNGNNARGGKTGGGEAAAGGKTSASRGPRGGRGAKNKGSGGSKGGNTENGGS